jgi:hypothetical protein
MSNNDVEAKESDTNVLQEVSRSVAITPEDCSGAADFWTHFEVPMPTSLKDAFEAFAKNPTFENQLNVKLQVCKAIGWTDHEAFNDEMFKEIVEECRNVTYDMGFDEALEKTLGEEEKK